MADISVTAANVLPSANATLRSGTAGATITAGQVLYIDTANSNVLKLADSDSATAIARIVAGISVCGGASGQPIWYVTEDPNFTFGGTVLSGDTIWLSDTAGGITKTFSELESGDYVTSLGIATSTTTMALRLCPNGVAGGLIA